MNLRGWRPLLFVVLAAGLLLLFTSFNVEAQCSMCRASLTSSTNVRFIRGLNIGVMEGTYGRRLSTGRQAEERPARP